MTSGEHDRVMWRRETITAQTEQTLRALRDQQILEAAYLAGGTGLALHFGHRRSLDLDFFATELFDEEALLQRILPMADVLVVARAPHTLHLTVQGIKVSFIGYAYPLLFRPALFCDVPVADPRDIACMKVTAIASRGTKRDFVDLFAACERFGLTELLNLFGRKYAQTRYSKVHTLKSLTYFEDADKDPMPHMLVPLNWQDVKRFFMREASLLA